jgi:hypothetical protein
MFRPAGLRLLLRGIRRFRTPAHPGALGACSVAFWPLPRPDLHREADGDVSRHTNPWLDGHWAEPNLTPSKNFFQPSHLFLYCKWSLEADAGAWKRCKPLLMTPSAPHLVAPLIIGGRPVHESHMGFVHRASRNQRLLAKSTLLTFLEAGYADLLRNEEEDDDIEAWNDDVSPATQRSREYPARVCIQDSTQQRLPLLSFSGLLKRRLGRLPEVIVSIKMDVPKGLRERVPQR